MPYFMKKLLLLLLLLPLSSFAKFYDGTISFKDGTVKVGLVEVPKHSRVDKILFKVKKGKAEKFDLKNVSGFTIINDDKETLRFITLKLSQSKAFKKEYYVEDEISWVRLDYEDTVSVVVAFIAPPLSMQSGEPVYYLHKKGDEHCSYITVFYEGNIVQLGQFKEIKRICDIIFKDDCPQLSEKLTKEAFKEKSLAAICDLYNELCAQK